MVDAGVVGRAGHNAIVEGFVELRNGHIVLYLGDTHRIAQTKGVREDLPSLEVTAEERIGGDSGLVDIELLSRIFEFLEEELIEVLLAVVGRFGIPADVTESGIRERHVAIEIGEDRADIDAEDTEGSVDIHHGGVILGLIDGIGEVTDSTRIEVVPWTRHLVIIRAMLAAVVGGIPAAHEMLGKRVGVETMYVHVVHISIHLQERVGELGRRIHGRSLRGVGIDLLVNFVRAGGER